MSAKIADHADLVAATEWSRQFYRALKDWDLARRGRWSTWEEGALMLTLDTSPKGGSCEPVNILAANNLIAFTTRGFEVQLPQPGQSFDAAIAALKDLTRKWFAGEIALAAFFKGDAWKGSTPIDPLRLQEEIAAAFQWIAREAQVDRVEIQTPNRETDQFFGLAVDGKPLARS
ncbi:MAG: hypothetical protein IV086_14170 [Hyphomonadaceae bacterium]|nr:MAG: hypothetical protein FD160_3653 [Caulobacteraceae bacterium]MBT9446843.1 hypothetical protein [Hyphomonadaceae bacterium]TPW05168.1 MAG: hypothetical protein FD124_2277 [Alphaproteobacteria bacterium]